MTMVEDLMERIHVEPNTGCWLWSGSTSSDGYGNARIGGKTVLVHRAIYEATHGNIPKGLVLDHEVCDTPACVNPDHLRPKANRDNVLRGVGPTATNARKAACKNGHQLSGNNLYVRPSGHRQCRACKNERQNKAKAQRRATHGGAR